MQALGSLPGTQKYVWYLFSRSLWSGSDIRQQAPIHSWQQRVVKRSVQFCGEGAVEALVNSDQECRDADKVVFELGMEE